MDSRSCILLVYDDPILVGLIERAAANLDAGRPTLLIVDYREMLNCLRADALAGLRPGGVVLSLPTQRGAVAYESQRTIEWIRARPDSIGTTPILLFAPRVTVPFPTDPRVLVLDSDDPAVVASSLRRLCELDPS
jgi:hypothetical protein